MLEVGHLIHEEHFSASNPGGAGMGLTELKTLTKAAIEASVGKCLKLLAAKRGLGGGHFRRVEAWVFAALTGLGLPEDALRVGKLFVGEESGLAVSHSETRLTFDAAVVVEEEESDVSGLGVAVDVDVVREGLTRCG